MTPVVCVLEPSLLVHELRRVLVDAGLERRDPSMMRNA